MPRSSILFVITILILSSCSDNENLLSVTYPSVYYRSGVKRGKEFSVYTKRGEVTAKSIRDKFFARDSAFFTTVDGYIWNPYYELDTVEFLNPYESNVEHVGCSWSMSNGLIVLARKDTLSRYCSDDVFTRTFNYNALQIKPNVVSESINSSTRGSYIFNYSAQFKFVLLGYDQKLVAPVTKYVVHSKYWEQRYVNNFFVPDFYKYLDEGDTLTMTDCFVTYQLKK